MTPEQRNYLAIERTRGYYTIMQTTIFAMTAIAGFILFGPQGYSAPLMALVVATTAYGILAGGTTLTDLKNLHDDMDDKMVATNFGAGLRARNLGALKTTSSVLLGLIGLAEIYAILF